MLCCVTSPQLLTSLQGSSTLEEEQRSEAEGAWREIKLQWPCRNLLRWKISNEPNLRVTLYDYDHGDHKLQQHSIWTNRRDIRNPRHIQKAQADNSGKQGLQKSLSFDIEEGKIRWINRTLCLWASINQNGNYRWHHFGLVCFTENSYIYSYNIVATHAR